MTRLMLFLTVITMLVGLAAAQSVQVSENEASEGPGEKKLLTVGDPAPELDIMHWVKGEAVGQLDSGRVYVVEFWATWCGPCVISMPHLSELQDEHGEQATIIGISNEPLEVVTKFLDGEDREGVSWHDKIRYRLTTDPDGSAWEDYFRAAGRRGIPSAFLVGKAGHIEWIGHPMQLDEPLAAVINGTWDRAAFALEYEVQRKVSEIQGELRAAKRAGEWDKAWEAVERMEAIAPDAGAMDLEKFQLLVGGLNKAAAGYKLGEGLVKRFWDDGSTLNMIAWFVVDDESVQRRDLKFAMLAAQRAADLTEHKSAAILDTLARVYYEQEEVEAAVDWQAKAVAAAESDRMAESLKETLVKYEKEVAGADRVVKD